MHLVDSVTAGLPAIDIDLASSTHSKQEGQFNNFVQFLLKVTFIKELNKIIELTFLIGMRG